MNLTELQMRAVRSPDKNLLILAGAGSGKTRVAVERIVWLIEEGMNPKEMVAICFTISASAELQRRINERIGEETPLKFIGTFHGWMLRVLKDAGRHVSVMSERETEEFVNERYFEACPTEARRRKITRQALDDVLKKGPERFEYRPAMLPTVEEIAFGIWKRMSDNGLMSYDALLYAGWKHIQGNGLTVGAICWDEFQDSANVDCHILEGIEAKSKTIIADPSQAIFSWRGGGNGMFKRLLQNAVKIWAVS